MMCMCFFQQLHDQMTPIASLSLTSLAFTYCPAHRREGGKFGLGRQISVEHLEVVKWNETQRWVITMLKYKNPFFWLCGLWDPGALTRDQTRALSSESSES